MNQRDRCEERAEAQSLKVSVVIPTHNRAHYLERLLPALRRQTLGVQRFEVIVVDDGSNDDTAEVLERLAATWPAEHLRVIRQPNQGPAAARNRGVEAARAPVVAFCDSDVEPDIQWLEKGLTALQDSDHAAVQCRVEISGKERITPLSHQTEHTSGLRHMMMLFIRKEVYLAFGGLDPAFGPRWFFREDTDFAFRLLDAGHTIGFAPEAIVRHPPVAGNWRTPFRLALRHVHDARLRRRHPQRYRKQVDVHRVGPLTVRRPRQRLYLALLAGLTLTGAAVATSWQAGARAGAGLSALFWAAIVWLHIRQVRRWNGRALVEAFYIALVTPALAFTWLVSDLWGRWRALRETSPRHKRAPGGAALDPKQTASART